MAAPQDLIGALRQADAAGDTEGAQRIAAMIQAQRTAPAAPPPAPAAKPPGWNDAVDNPLTAGVIAAGHEMFGVGDLAATGGNMLHQALNGQPVDYAAARAREESVRHALASRYPVSSTVGGVAGAVDAGVVGGGALKAAGVAAPAALALKEGQPLVNAARLAATGSAAAGAQGAAQGASTGAQRAGVPGAVHDAAGGLAAGMAFGAVAGPVAGVAAGAVAKAIAPLNAKVAAVLAKTLNESASDVQAAWANFTRATGRAPSMAEIAGAKSRGEIKAMAQDYGTVGRGLADRANDVAAARPASMQAAVAADGPAASSGDLGNVRSAQAAKDYAPVDAGTYHLTPEGKDFITGEVMPSATLARPQRQAIARALEDNQISGTDVQAIRAQLGDRAARDPASRYGQMALDLEGHLDTPENAALVQAHQTATDNFRAGSDRMEGAALGEKAVKQSGDTPNFLAETQAATAPRRSGTPNNTGDTVAEGARSALSSRAMSQTGALSLARQLATDGGLHARLSATLGGDTADALRTLGQAETASHEALSGVTQSTPRPDSKVEAGAIQHLLHFTAVAQPHGSAMWKVFHAGQAMAGVRMSPAVQDKVASYLADPKMVPQGIALLRKAGADSAHLRQLALQAAQGAGLLMGAAGADATQGNQ